MSVSTAIARGGQLPAPGRPARSGKRQSLRADIAGLSPALVLYAVFIVVPMLVALFLSFTSWQGIGQLQWVGIRNWSRFISDPDAHNSLKVTLELAGLSWLVQTPLAMALGIFVAGRQRYRAAYAAIYLVPLLISTAGLALMWHGVLDPYAEDGGIALLGNSLHIGFLKDQAWLSDPNVAFYVVVGILAWQFVPFHTLIYQAGRRAIPAELYEAARIDGAGRFQTFRHITLPQLRYSIVTYFDIIYILTLGGPSDTTNVLAMEMYTVGFREQEFGYASVVGVVLGVLGIAVALLLVRLTGFGQMGSGQEGIS
jgi:raffinose/stachyose/melibiose transport system permease protein